MVPLWVWGAVCAMGLLLFLVLGSVDLAHSRPFKNTHELRYATYKVRLQNLQRQQPPPPDVFRVIIFGSSLTAQGVMRDSFFNKRFQQLGKPVVVNRVFYAGAFYNMLEDPDLLTFLEDVQPDLLCIEDQVLLLEPPSGLNWPGSLLTQLHTNFIYNINVLKHQALPTIFTHPGLSGPIDSAGTFNVTYPVADSTINHRDSTNYQLETRKVRGLDRTPKFNQFIKALREQGTELVALHLPRPAEIEKKYLSKGVQRQKQRLLDQYEEQADLEYWSDEWELPFRYFWDISHLNKHGQEAFSDWLFDQILEEFEDRQFH